jgi:hypothetical protein
MITIKALENTTVTRDEFLEILGKSSQLWATPPAYLYGKRVISKDDKYILFYQCEYCSGKDVKDGLYNTTVCCDCGAPV